MTSTTHSDYEAFARKRQTVIDIAAEVREIASSLALVTWEQVVAKTKERISADNFKVLVIGEFSRGKSTLINCLLGAEVLPTFATETTAIINEIKWGETQRAALHRLIDGADKNTEVEHISIHDLERYVVVDLDEEDARQAIEKSTYKKIEIFWPLDLLQKGVEIIDSPGLNAHRTREEITLNYLSSVDAIIFVLDSQFLVARSELEVIDSLRRFGHEDIFFVCNKFNLIREKDRDRVQKVAYSKLGTRTQHGERRIFFVDALSALESRKVSDGRDIALTGIPRFEKDLAVFLAEERGKIKILRAAAELKHALREAQRTVPDREKLLNTNMAELEDRFQRASLPLSNLEMKRKNIVDTANNFLLDTREHVQLITREQIRKILSDVPTWVEEYELQNTVTFSFSRTKIETQLADAVKEVATALSKRFETELSEWQSTTLVPEMERRLEALRAKLEPATQQFIERLEEIRVSISHNTAFSTTDLGEHAPSAIERVLAAAGGFIAVGPGAAAIGAAFGYKEMVKALIPNLLIGMLAAILIGFNPWVLIPLLLGTGLIQGFFKMQATNERIKTDVGKKFVDEVRSRLADLSDQAGSQTYDHLSQHILEPLNRGLGNEIQVLRDQVRSVLAEKQKGETAVKKELEVLARTRDELLRVQERLDEMIVGVQLGSVADAA